MWNEVIPYEIGQHSHRLAAWAASRAASVNGCRFSVQQGRAILEHCGFHADFASPDLLPPPTEIDGWHSEKRLAAIETARVMGLPFTHGVAAKLINCYLKVRFICGGHHEHQSATALHPPIDKLLLEGLAAADFGGERQTWRRASKRGWSKLDATGYQNIIDRIRHHLHGQPLWLIEEHWPGNQ